jgi:hypothetical protein
MSDVIIKFKTNQNHIHEEIRSGLNSANACCSALRTRVPKCSYCSSVRCVLVLDSTFFVQLNSCHSDWYCQLLTTFTKPAFFSSYRVTQEKYTRASQNTLSGRVLRTPDLNQTTFLSVAQTI